MDVNSGDMRTERELLRVRIAEETSPTPFSTEARRLGIQTAGKRDWKVMHRKSLGRRHRSSDYFSALGQMYLLMKLLDALKIPDEERKTILEAAIQSLQAGQPNAIRAQVNSLAKRLPKPEHQSERNAQHDRM